MFESEIRKDYFVVTDGCRINSLDSNVVGNEDWAKSDFLFRVGAGHELRWDARRSLLFVPVDSLEKFFEKYKNGTTIDLKCPECGKVYGVGRKLFYETLGEDPSDEIREAI